MKASPPNHLSYLLTAREKHFLKFTSGFGCQLTGDRQCPRSTRTSLHIAAVRKRAAITEISGIPRRSTAGVRCAHAYTTYKDAALLQVRVKGPQALDLANRSTFNKGDSTKGIYNSDASFTISFSHCQGAPPGYHGSQLKAVGVCIFICFTQMQLLNF